MLNYGFGIFENLLKYANNISRDELLIIIKMDINKEDLLTTYKTYALYEVYEILINLI